MNDSPERDLPIDHPLNRYIDRFLYADGWRVTRAVASDDSATPGSWAVTITKTEEPFKGHVVTRSASSAGEAAFKACSGAR